MKGKIKSVNIPENVNDQYQWSGCDQILIIIIKSGQTLPQHTINISAREREREWESRSIINIYYKEI